METPELDTLEYTAELDIHQQLAEARRAAQTRADTPAAQTQRLTTVNQRIRAAGPRITNTTQEHLATAARIGTANAAVEAPPPSRSPFVINQDALGAILGPIDFRGDINHIVDDVTSRVRPRVPTNLLTHVESVFGRLWRAARTNLFSAYNRGKDYYARLYGYDLRWFTREDEMVCPVCAPMHEVVIASRERFEAEPDWEAFDGRPPLHPNCRCFTQVIRRGLTSRG